MTTTKSPKLFTLELTEGEAEAVGMALMRLYAEMKAKTDDHARDLTRRIYAAQDKLEIAGDKAGAPRL